MITFLSLYFPKNQAFLYLITHIGHIGQLSVGCYVKKTFFFLIEITRYLVAGYLLWYLIEFVIV